MDDTWVDEMVFAKNLDAMLSEKLYSHDQKKMVQKVNLGKEPEAHLTAIRNEMMGFYLHFGQKLKNVFGYISYRNLQEFLERI